MIDKIETGQIITFYSYKGGTGRSMALANVACLLAQRWSLKKDVLMIDWDLEAPGLHQYFLDKFIRPKDKNGNLPKNQLGLIDLFYEFKHVLDDLNFESEIPDSFFKKINISKYITDLSIPSLKLMTAGRLDDKNYPSRVNSFNWEEFFDKYPLFINQFANYLRNKFGFVLIDSRTGYTDTSGICTSLMPEKLVVVFTPNRQSLIGVEELIRNATEYRKQSEDLRPLIVFPLASRIENAEDDLQKLWRFGSSLDEKIIGYQPLFELVLKEVYKLPSCDLTKYFDEVQLQYKPRYSYGEEIAVLSERTEDRLSIANSYENCTKRLVELERPWEKIEDISLNQIQTIETDNIVNNLRDRKLKVFLCHAATDKARARDVSRQLQSEGWIEPWLDQEKLLPGQDWSVEVEKAVEEADSVIVFLSKNSVTKEGYIQRELRYALDVALEKPERDIYLIPLRLDNCEMPSRLQKWNYLDYFPESHKDSSYHTLLSSLLIRAKQIGKHTKSKIFISYSSFDKAFASELASRLERANVDVWWQEKFTQKSEIWEKTVQHAINDSSYFVVILTPRSVESLWIREELSYALSIQLPILPIMLEECRIPLALANHQILDITKMNNKNALQIISRHLNVNLK